MHPVLRIQILLYLVSCILYPASSAHADLDMQIQPGFDGYHKYNRWLPLRIALASTDESITGEVTVEIQDSTAGTRQIYAIPTAFSKATRKVQYLYVIPESFRRNLQVMLMDNYGKKLIQKDSSLVAISPKDLLIVVITPTGGGLEFLDDLPEQDAPSKETHVSYSAARSLPDKWKGYDSVDVIVLGDVSVEALSSHQQQAIADWVYSGGRLVVSGGAYSQDLAGTFVEELLPVRIDGTRTLDSISSLSLQSRDQRIVVASSELTDRGRIIAAEDDGLPIVAKREAGYGTVIFLAFDYLDPVFRAWAGKRRMWKELLLERVSTRPSANVGSVHPPPAAGFRGVPSYKFIGLFLLAYILCFGPLNYLILRRFNRSKWAWMTMSSIVAVFTIGSLAIAYVTKARTAVVNDFSVVDVYQDTGRARIDSYFSLSSPAGSDYRIEFPASEAVFVNRVPPQDREVHQDVDYRLVEEDVFQVEMLRLNTMAPQFFHGESYVDLNGSISINLSENTDEIVQGEVTSKLPFRLADCYVFSNDRYVYIGDLSPGSQAQVRLERAYSGRIPDLYSTRGGEKHEFINTMKPNLFPRVPGRGLVGWMDGSALKTLSGMNMQEDYKALGTALIIIHL